MLQHLVKKQSTQTAHHTPTINNWGKSIILCDRGYIILY